MISRIIRNSLCVLLSLYVALWPVSSISQTATLLPNGMQQFFDNNGNPLSSGTVDFYIPNTTTRKNTWQDAAETIVNTNPVLLDGAGRALIYGDGSYRQVLKDSSLNLIWDKVVSSFANGSTIITTGDGDQVGTVKPWAGILAPNQYAFANGQEISRTTFAALFTAITQTLNVACTNGSPIITGVADTTQIPIGAKIELNCVPPGTTVTNKTSTSVTLSAASNVTLNTTATFFAFGNGNGTTTFNLPDLRGYVVAGRPNMGGTASTNLTAAFFGNTPAAIGATGGNQSRTLIAGNLPAYTPSGSVALGYVDPGHTHFLSSTHATFTFVTTSGGGPVGLSGSFTAENRSATDIAATGITFSPSFTGNAQGGTSTPFASIQPTITLNYIIKITPDTSAQQASGVASLGGMIGAIACGTGLLCTGNVISSSLTVAIDNGVSNHLAFYVNPTEISSSDILTYTVANGLTISPIVNTYNQALNILQTGPTSGPIAGPIAYNLVQGTNSATVTGSGVGQDGLNNSNNVLFKARYILGGANWQGQASAAGQFTASVSNGAGNASSPDAVGLGGSAYINVLNPSTTAGIFGVVPFVYVDNGGSISQAVGSEIDVWVKTGGVATQRIGQRIRSQGDIQSSGGIDAAVVVDNFGAAGAAWKSLITISKNGSGIIPMDTTASLFNNDAAMTIANVFNSSNLALTGDFANFPNFRIGGSGIAKFGSGGSLPAAPAIIQASVLSGGTSNLYSSTNTTVGFNGFDANTSTGSSNGSFIIDEPNRTTTRFGITVGNWVELITSGAGNNGLIIGTLTNVPIVLGINSNEVMRLKSTGLSQASAAILDWNNDTFIGRNAAATVRFGAADAASPVAQITSVQSVVTGNSNVAGANWTFTGSKGTGTGAAGPIIWQTAHAGTTGSTPNTLVEDMRLDGLGNLLVGIASAPSLGDTSTGSTRLSIQGTGGSNTSFGYIQMMNSLVANASEMGRFTWGSPTFSGADKRTAVIRSLHQTVSTVNPTGDIEFFTSNAGTLTEAMRVQPSGGISIGTSTDPGIGFALASKALQTSPLTVATLPTCNAASEGARAYVTDQNTAVAYRGAVTGAGATRQAVLCSNTAWIQD